MAQGVFRLKVFYRRFFQSRSGVKYRNPVGDFQRQLNIVGDQKNAVALVGKFAKMAHGFFGRFQMKSGSGLVRNDETGIFHHGGAQ